MDLSGKNVNLNLIGSINEYLTVEKSDVFKDFAGREDFDDIVEGIPS